MVATIRILKSQADDLAAVCTLGYASLERVLSGLNEAERTIRRDRVRATVKAALNDDEEGTATLCRVVFGLSSITSRHRSSKIADTIEGVSAALKVNFRTDDRLQDWDRIAPLLLQILQNESVHLTAKAVDVSYDFERVLTDCRILTSIRPIYTDRRDGIVGSTIVQTLRLDYVNGSGDSDTISIAVDLSDIKRLSEVCAEAEEKADVAKERLGTWDGDVIMAGEQKS